ncbi:hypothetical protein D9M71_364550 [compost metagenome]
MITRTRSLWGAGLWGLGELGLLGSPSRPRPLLPGIAIQVMTMPQASNDKFVAPNDIPFPGGVGHTRPQQTTNNKKPA